MYAIRRLSLPLHPALLSSDLIHLKERLESPVGLERVLRPGLFANNPPIGFDRLITVLEPLLFYVRYIEKNVELLLAVGISFKKLLVEINSFFASQL